MSKLIGRARRSKIAELIPFPKDKAIWPYVEEWSWQGLRFEEALSRAEWGILPVKGGAVETGQVMLQNVPTSPYRFSPAEFFAATERNEYEINNFAYAAGSQWTPQQLPLIGIYGKLVLQFDGTVTVGTANATSTQKWPYGLLDAVAFKADGQNDLYSCQGLALKAQEQARYPYAFQDNDYPDDILGGGIGAGLTLAVGAIPIRLTYEISQAFDEASLVGALFAQSRALNILLTGRDNDIAQIATAGGGGTVTIAGTWRVLLQSFQVPVDSNGQLVLPDLRFLHGFNELITPISGVGETKTTLVKVAGTLQRLFIQNVQQSTAAPDIYDPTVAAEVDAYRLEFAGNKKPYVYDPAQKLVSRNVRDYGRVLPYRYVCLDFARYNAMRDAINLAGITDAYWITDIDDAATPGTGPQQRVVQETLYQ